MASNDWTTSTSSSYIYVGDSASASTSDSYVWRAPTTYNWYADSTITIDSSPTDLFVEGDIHAEEFEKRLRGEIMEEVKKYVQGMIPTIIAMATEHWVPILDRKKEFTTGVFCFNCGAAIVRGHEHEECAYCGR